MNTPRRPERLVPRRSSTPAGAIRAGSGGISRITRRGGYTLVEVLVCVVVLGIAASMLVPSMSSTDVLRVQAGVRAIVSDITFAQADAMAFQESRAVVFDPADSRYFVVQMRNNVIDLDANTMSTQRIDAAEFGDTRIVSVNVGNDSNALVFDEMGMPVTAPGSDTPLSTGTIDITGSRQRFRVQVEGFTGRVTVTRTADNTNDPTDPTTPED